MIAKRGHDFSGQKGPTPRPAFLAALVVIVGATLPGAGSAQATPPDPQAAPPMGAMGGMAAMPMIMATDDHKVFRLIRPTVAAIQLRMLEAGMFSSSANGLLGPSTVRALGTYQRSRGLEVTGLPDGRTVLDLMGLQERFGEVREHLEMGAMSAPMAGHQMDAGEVPGGMPGGMPSGMPSDMPSGDPLVDGDPQQAKSLMLMEMPNMVIDDRHTRSVRAVREVVASLQLRLSDEGLFGGMASGFLEAPGFRDAVLRYQARQGVDETGIVDLATALYLLGSDAERLMSLYRGRIDLEAAPVAMDGDLMRLSSGRRQRNPPNMERDE